MAVQRPGGSGRTEDGGSAPGAGRLPRPACDGRLARGERTRTALVEATDRLIRSGRPNPTARQVAEQAGVSVRLVFHHFGEVGVLYDRAAALQSARARALIGIVPPRGPTAVRIKAICRQRRQLFESLAPDPRTAPSGRGLPPDLGEDLHLLLRRQLMVGLRPEILAAGTDAPVLFEALATATGWPNWRSLRADGRRSAAEVERVVVYAASLLLAGTPGTPPSGAR